MNITVFGATGAIGQILTNYALQNGDIVTAYVRRLGSLKNTHENLKIIVGELTDQSLIENAIEHADVVMNSIIFTRNG